jgi:hypothetical protein
MEQDSERQQTAAQKVRAAKEAVRGLISTQHGEGHGMTASGEHLAVVGQNAAIDEYAAKVVSKHRESE